MSRVDRFVARRQEQVHEVTRLDSKGRKVTVKRAHKRGDHWWRSKFAELIEKRRTEK